MVALRNARVDQRRAVDAGGQRRNVQRGDAVAVGRRGEGIGLRRRVRKQIQIALQRRRQVALQNDVLGVRRHAIGSSGNRDITRTSNGYLTCDGGEREGSRWHTAPWRSRTANGEIGLSEVGNGAFAIRRAVWSGGHGTQLHVFRSSNHRRCNDRQTFPTASRMRTTITQNEEGAEDDTRQETHNENDPASVLVCERDAEALAAQVLLAVPVHAAPLLPSAATRAHASAAINIGLVLVLHPVVAEEGVCLVGTHEERMRDGDGGDAFDAHQRRFQSLRKLRRARLVKLLRRDCRVELDVDRVDAWHPGGDAHLLVADVEKGGQRRHHAFALLLLREGEGRLREVLQLQVEVEIRRGLRLRTALREKGQLAGVRHEGVLAPALEIGGVAATVASALDEGSGVHREQSGTRRRAIRSVEPIVAHAILALVAAAVSVAHVAIDERTVQPPRRRHQPRVLQTVRRLHVQRLLRTTPHVVGGSQIEPHQRNDRLALRDVPRARKRISTQRRAGSGSDVLGGACAEDLRVVAVANTHADHVVQDALQMRRKDCGGHLENGGGGGVGGARSTCQGARRNEDRKIASEKRHQLHASKRRVESVDCRDGTVDECEVRRSKIHTQRLRKRHEQREWNGVHGSSCVRHGVVSCEENTKGRYD